jgi:hypothetical protein
LEQIFGFYFVVIYKTRAHVKLKTFMQPAPYTGVASRVLLLLLLVSGSQLGPYMVKAVAKIICVYFRLRRLDPTAGQLQQRTMDEKF